MNSWQRLTFDDKSIYINPDGPDWLVPNQAADRLLQALLETGNAETAACRLQGAGTPGCGHPLAQNLIELQRLDRQLVAGEKVPYLGRHRCLSLDALKECWVHLTDRCNLACRHCLFAASPAATRAIAPALLDNVLAEAKSLGCHLYYFTGGEPFVYPDFTALLNRLLADAEVHAVVLTNGLLVEEQLDALRGLPVDRLHLQISLDGLREVHDRLRGSGTFARLEAALAHLRGAGFEVTLSVAVNRENIASLPDLVRFAAEKQIRNIHFLWHFILGKGAAAQFVPPEEILPRLIAAQELAETVGVTIDNVEALRAQVFSTPGTRFDLSNAGWESLAVGPDGHVYPSPALVGIPALDCGSAADGLGRVWRHSPVLETVRNASLIDHAACRNDPLRFLIGGNDIDHSFIAGGEFVGHDPYVSLYNGVALWLISRQAASYTGQTGPHLLLRMGEVRHDCPGGQAVAMTHCNCVISFADDKRHRPVRGFYARAAREANDGIRNPFAPEQETARFIPEESRQRSYGCGSPVSDAGLREGEVLVDLGSGSGVECFMAAAKVGGAGKVYGIDMTDEMLALARTSQQEVRLQLGYDNIEFRRGYLEAIPLGDDSADAVISNCVINLSPDKRRTFQEIHRILKPGGRMVISDIVTEGPVPPAIKNDTKLRGECLGGAMQQEALVAMLAATGFSGICLIKRFPYRREGGTLFFSLTFMALKPAARAVTPVIYRGPFAAVVTDSGLLLRKGQRVLVPATDLASLDDSVFVLNEDGRVTNLQMIDSCCTGGGPDIIPLRTFKTSATSPSVSTCSPASQVQQKIIALPVVPHAGGDERHLSGCMACGAGITYLQYEQAAACHYCGGTRNTNSLCVNGHFICDDCHQRDALSLIKVMCLETGEQDMLALLRRIRRHPAVSMHGPEHHAMVPGIMLATYRNRGGRIGKEAVLSGIERGSKVPGGVCGFWGNCGAATGAGIAFSVLLNASPLTPAARQQVQAATARILARIAEIRGSRCCQREAVIALREAALISRELLPVTLLAEEAGGCEQSAANKECIRKQCPFFLLPAGQGMAADSR